MKTTAFILGILGVFSFASCRCNLEEDEPSDKKKNNVQASSNTARSPESDSLSIR
ncbi:hypothetical protein [Chryseobacterium bernardetii]|uniref:hypothetical protein n=1 Tax=Chryseobacterium bernardetii TaxID=1241978 RepID=UPI003AF9124B